LALSITSATETFDNIIAKLISKDVNDAVCYRVWPQLCTVDMHGVQFRQFRHNHCETHERRWRIMLFCHRDRPQLCTAGMHGGTPDSHHGVCCWWGWHWYHTSNGNLKHMNKDKNDAVCHRDWTQLCTGGMHGEAFSTSLLWSTKENKKKKTKMMLFVTEFDPSCAL